MQLSTILLLSLLSFGLLLLFKGMRIVPHQEVWIIQRLGKYHRSLRSGLNWIVPFMDRVAYIHSLKEEAIDVHEQTAITQDNVSVTLDGILYVKITDPQAASYGVKDAHYAITQLVQTTMRSEIGKIPLDKTFEERESLNKNIVSAINEAAATWGIQCMRYEIKDITMPDDIKKAMELQMTAERQKRARILESEGLRQAHINESEGKRQSQINLAHGHKEKVVLESEAAFTDKVNRAKGEAEAISCVAKATAESIEALAASIVKNGGEKAVALRLAEQYITAFHQMAKEGTTLLLPQDASNAGSMIAQALSIFDSLKAKSSIKKLKAKVES